MLGRSLERSLGTRGRPTVGLDRAHLDITDTDSVARVFREHRPTLLFNAAAYTKVSAAYAIQKDDPARSRAIDAALAGAAQPPVEVARRAARLVTLAREIAEIGNKNARSDGRVAEALARAAVAGAIENVRVNVAGVSDPALGKELLAETERLERDLRA